MKPIAPVVPLPVWGNLYTAAERFRSLKPWKVLDDRDLIGVCDPTTGEMGYACIMGSAGTVFGLCLYRGSEGFDSYRRLMEGEFDPESIEPLFIQNCLKIDFGNKSELEPEDLEVVQGLGLERKGVHAWPQFRGLLPGYFPWFLDEAEARFLTFGVDVACYHFSQIQKFQKVPSVKDGGILVYRPDKKAYAGLWEPWPIHRPEPYSPLLLDYPRARTARAQGEKPDSPWEAGVFFIPKPVSEGGRPYFSRVCVVCQASSGFMFNIQVGGPSLSDPQMLTDVILGSIERHGFIPASIRFADGVTVAALAPLSKALEIPFEHAKTLPAVRDARNGVIKALGSGRLGS